jgi:hypothetical protein
MRLEDFDNDEDKITKIDWSNMEWDTYKRQFKIFKIMAEF